MAAAVTSRMPSISKGQGCRNLAGQPPLQGLQCSRQTGPGCDTAPRWRPLLIINLGLCCARHVIGCGVQNINNENQPPDFVPPRHRSFMLFTGEWTGHTAREGGCTCKQCLRQASQLTAACSTCMCVSTCVKAAAACFHSSQSPPPKCMSTHAAFCPQALPCPSLPSLCWRLYLRAWTCCRHPSACRYGTGCSAEPFQPSCCTAVCS
jgi:hypothetical protein